MANERPRGYSPMNLHELTKSKENKWSNYGLRIFASAASHPFEYAKVLIQLGYEPIPPRPTTTFFGKPALKLPNVFEYVKHIKTVDGFGGCYRGVTPKLCGNLLSAVVTQKIIDSLGPIENDLDDDEEETEEIRWQKFKKSIKSDVLAHTAAIVISQPFHVITVRIMAQFVGKETKYFGLFGSIKEIYQQNGVAGFFSGLIPRLLGDIISILLASSLTYAINTYLIEEKDMQVYTSATMSFMSTAITYPFQVVSNCMSVNRSGLMAGSPPFMPLYGSWVDCWKDLSGKNQLKRGSSLLIRYYVGPHIIIGGQAMQVPAQMKM